MADYNSERLVSQRQDELEELELKSVILYDNNWNVIEQSEGEYCVWGKQSLEGKAEVLLPVNDSFADYFHRLSHAVSEIVRIDGRAREELIEMLKNSSSHVKLEDRQS